MLSSVSNIPLSFAQACPGHNNLTYYEIYPFPVSFESEMFYSTGLCATNKFKENDVIFSCCGNPVMRLPLRGFKNLRSLPEKKPSNEDQPLGHGQT